jgi:hypothetical protein
MDDLGQSARIIDGKLCLSTAAMCEVLRVSKQALGKWASNGCPKARNGWWPLADVLHWRGIAAGTAGKDESAASQQQRYAADLKRLQAEKIAIQNEVSRGNWIPRDQVVTTLTRWLADFKRSALAFSRIISIEVSSYVDPATARRIGRDFDDMIKDFLKQVSAGEIYVPPKKRTSRR